MGSRSKDKGSNAEREVSKILATHLGGYWVRTPGSGAFVGGSNAHRSASMSPGQVRHHRGDLMPPDDLMHMVIEVKHYASIPWHHLLSPQCRQMDGWLDQLHHDTKDGDLPILLWKVDRCGWFVTVSATRFLWTLPDATLRYHSAKHGLQIICQLESFLMLNLAMMRKIPIVEAPVERLVYKTCRLLVDKPSNLSAGL